MEMSDIVDTSDNEVDYFQNVATSSYGDMLWDVERNNKFRLAIKRAIAKRKSESKSTHLLDVGTGTGLLSMMAVEYGADSVTACEMFKPVADCARRIIEENGFKDQIKIINKHSTALTVGCEGDLAERADILVSEVFDTELIGEGALETFNHAHDNLLKPDAIVIPSIGTVYCQVVESKFLMRWQSLQDWDEANETKIRVPDLLRKCRGAPSLFDFQMSQLPVENFQIITDPIPLFTFDFMRNKKLPRNEFKSMQSVAKIKAKAQAVFMWWDLLMDEEEILLSCAPVWAHPDNQYVTRNAVKIPWRDHWMQAVYFLPKQLPLSKEEPFTLRGWHDEFSFWFDICQHREKCSCAAVESPICTCGLHVLASRTRFAAMNDPHRRSKFASALQQVVDNRTSCVFFGDISLVGLLIAEYGAYKVHIFGENMQERTYDIYRSFPQFSNDKIKLHKSLESVVNSLRDESPQKICIVAEPFFISSLLPWENFKFLSMKADFLEAAKDFINTEKLSFLPESVTLRAVCVKFDDLWKIHRPLVTCQGFKMNFFDRLISEAKMVVENRPEPQPLWEYPCKALSEPADLYKFKTADPVSNIHTTINLPYEGNETIDGVVFWLDYHLTKNVTLSTGPRCPIKVGEYISWDFAERQGVRIFSSPKASTEFVAKIDFDLQLREFDITLINA